jgi:hypothetical protein
VVALVRSPAAATRLEQQGCEIVVVDLRDEAQIRHAARGCDAVLHLGRVYKIGIPAARRGAMYEANVGGPERVLDAAVEAGVVRIVHVSTLNAFANKRGKVVDESYVLGGEITTLGERLGFPLDARGRAHVARRDLLGERRQGAPRARIPAAATSTRGSKTPSRRLVNDRWRMQPPATRSAGAVGALGA